MKCVLSDKESNFNAKNGSKYSHLVTVRAEGADPPPITVSLTIKRPFFWTNPLAEILYYNSNLQKGGREPKCIGIVWNPCRAESLLDGG